MQQLRARVVKLSLADRLALIYTSAGSMRKTAALAGLSHQQVSRILHKSAQGQSTDYYEKNVYIRAAVDVAFDIHTDLSRGVAKRHGLPFDKSIPVYTERLPLTNHALYENGELVFKGSLDDIDKYIDENEPDGDLKIKRLLGERVGALHVHWLSDRLRDKYLKTQQKTGAYYQASVSSVVNLPEYMKRAAARINNYMKQGGIKTADMIKAREQLKNLIKDDVKLARVFTPYTSMDPRFPSELVTQNINDKLQTRHAPATGDKGTLFADQILLQLDTRKSKDAIPGKTRRTARKRK